MLHVQPELPPVHQKRCGLTPKKIVTGRVWVVTLSSD
jgi:hypothetical protein